MVKVSFGEASRRQRPYEDLVRQLLLADAADEAVVVSDRARGRVLAELLASPRTGTGRGLEPPLEDPPAPQATIRDALAAQALYLIRSADAVLHAQGAPLPINRDEVKTLARELGAFLLVIQPIHLGIVVMLIDPDGGVHDAPTGLDGDQIRERMNSLFEQFTIHTVPRGTRARISRGETGGDRMGNMDDLLGDLWRGLIGPVASFLEPGWPVIVAPFGRYGLIPFGLLLGPDGQFLGERHPISIVPSLGVLCDLQARGDWQRPCPNRAYVAGDPACDARWDLDRLFSARDEAEAVGRMVYASGTDPGRIMVRLDADATERSYREEAAGADLVHLACHAELNEPAFTSCLYLAPNPPEDGMLLASEVIDTRLSDALVFLSACRTGQGRPTADGVIGLGRAFLQAGARAVVMSLWPVSDPATATLARHFYDSLLGDPPRMHAAAALAAAQEATRKDLQAGLVTTEEGEPVPVHPANWAPFIILGDALAVRYQ